MIEKLKWDEQPEDAAKEVQNLIDHLVDAVNEFEKDREEIKEWIAIVSDLRSRVPVVESRVSILEEHAHPAETPVDPYAEQRKWVGKLCRFRDNSACEWKYGILEKIDEDADFPFWDTDCYEYAECEPVKPDDDIIYKGGDNE